MATQRIESGRVEMRSVGNVPMQQITPRPIDYTTAANIQARGANQLAQVIDRMSQSAFEMAGEMSKQAALIDVANTPPTDEQLELAKNGDMSQIDFGSSRLSVYGAAVRKARSFQLSNAFEQEAKAKAVEILTDVDNGLLTAEQAAQKINTLTTGFSRSLASEDGDAALKFTASMGVYANTIMAEAHKKDRAKAKEQKMYKLGATYQDTLKLVKTALKQGLFVDATGQAQPVEKYLELHRNSISQSAFSANGIVEAQKYEAQFDVDVVKARIDVATEIVLQEEYMANQHVGIDRLLKGDLGSFSPVWMNMNESDKKAVRDNFLAAVRARKEGVELNLADSQRQGDNILRQIYLAPNVGEMSNLLTQLNGLPVSPSTISQARTFIRTMSTEGRANDDLSAFGRVTQRIALGLATEAEIINGPFTNATKRTLIGQQANPGNAINAGVTRINSAVNIQSADLPPEFADAPTRELAVKTRSTLTQQLYDFARTPDEKGMLPNNTAITAKGVELANQAKAGMSSAFVTTANASKNSAVSMLPELSGVDLMDESAVTAAFTKATARKANSTLITSARSSVEAYRKNMRQVEGQK
jgi:hypothetical protein